MASQMTVAALALFALAGCGRSKGTNPPARATASAASGAPAHPQAGDSPADHAISPADEVRRRGERSPADLAGEAATRVRSPADDAKSPADLVRESGEVPPAAPSEPRPTPADGMLSPADLARRDGPPPPAGLPTPAPAGRSADVAAVGRPAVRTGR